MLRVLTKSFQYLLYNIMLSRYQILLILDISIGIAYWTRIRSIIYPERFPLWTMVNINQPYSLVVTVGLNHYICTITVII